MPCSRGAQGILKNLHVNKQEHNEHKCLDALQGMTRHPGIYQFAVLVSIVIIVVLIISVLISSNIWRKKYG